MFIIKLTLKRTMIFCIVIYLYRIQEVYCNFISVKYNNDLNMNWKKLLKITQDTYIKHYFAGRNDLNIRQKAN